MQPFLFYGYYKMFSSSIHCPWHKTSSNNYHCPYCVNKKNTHGTESDVLPMPITIFSENICHENGRSFCILVPYVKRVSQDTFADTNHLNLLTFFYDKGSLSVWPTIWRKKKYMYKKNSNCSRRSIDLQEKLSAMKIIIVNFSRTNRFLQRKDSSELIYIYISYVLAS